MIQIPLTQGQFALIDDEDHPLVEPYKWVACNHRGYTFYTGTFKKKENGKYDLLLMHRLLMNPPTGIVIDHIDHNGLNNCRNNLRFATHFQNAQNSHSNRGTSKYKGVSWCKCHKKWRSRITINGKNIKLGRFIDEVEAANAYDKAAIELFGEFALTNEFTALL